MNGNVGRHKLLYILEKVEKLFEMPWVTAAPDKVIDLKFERCRNREEMLVHIKSELEKLEPWEQKEFIDNLFGDYWVVMDRNMIFKDQVINLIKKQPVGVYG